MQSLVAIVVLAFGVLGAVSMATGQTLTIDSSILPTSVNASFAHAFATAGSTNNASICGPNQSGVQDPNGKLVSCSQYASTSANEWAKADSSSEVDQLTGIGTLSASVSAAKVTFAAAAAYAKGGTTKPATSAVNLGTQYKVYIGHMKITANSDPIDAEAMVSVSNLAPNELADEFRQILERTDIGQKQIAGLLKEGFVFKKPGDYLEYVRLPIRLHGDDKAGPDVGLIRHGVGPCPAEVDLNKITSVCILSERAIESKDFFNPFQGFTPPECDKYVTDRKLKSPYVIRLWFPPAVLSKALSISVDWLHCAALRGTSFCPEPKL